MTTQAEEVDVFSIKHEEEFDATSFVLEATEAHKDDSAIDQRVHEAAKASFALINLLKDVQDVQSNGADMLIFRLAKTMVTKCLASFEAPKEEFLSNVLAQIRAVVNLHTPIEDNTSLASMHAMLERMVASAHAGALLPLIQNYHELLEILGKERKDVTWELMQAAFKGSVRPFFNGTEVGKEEKSQIHTRILHICCAMIGSWPNGKFEGKSKTETVQVEEGPTESITQQVIHVAKKRQFSEEEERESDSPPSEKRRRISSPGLITKKSSPANGRPSSNGLANPPPSSPPRGPKGPAPPVTRHDLGLSKWAAPVNPSWHLHRPTPIHAPRNYLSPTVNPKKLHVSGFAGDATSDDIWKLFDGYTLTEIFRPQSSIQSGNPQFFVEFASTQEAQLAQQTFNGYRLAEGGQQLRVAFARY